jgi:hypothetical protein
MDFKREREREREGRESSGRAETVSICIATYRHAGSDLTCKYNGFAQASLDLNKKWKATGES